MAKSFASETAMDITPDAVPIRGGYGSSAEVESITRWLPMAVPCQRC